MGEVGPSLGGDLGESGKLVDVKVDYEQAWGETWMSCAVAMGVEME